jgi:regulator of chromosome condensation (RCC1) repeat-containing protein
MRRALPAVITALLTAGILLGPPVGAQPAADPVPSTYTAMSPTRVLDTRDGTGAGTRNPIGPGGTVTLDLSARVPDTATAVVLNVTGVTPTANTFVAIYPAGISRPTTSNLNLPPGDIRAIQVTVTLGTNSSVTLYNNAGNTHVVADLAGYYGTDTAAKFTALSPNRVLDTRDTNSPVGPGGVRTVDLSSRLPASATAVTFNLTGTAASTATVVTAFPSGTARPSASSLNLPSGDTRANLVTVAVGADRKVNLYNNTGTVHLLVDVTGFYTPDYGSVFLPRNPTRVLDTRNGTGTDGTLPLEAEEVRSVDLTDSGVPVTATGAVLNITAVDLAGSTFVATWPQWEDRPAAGSALNVSANQIVSNAAVVPFVRSLGVDFYNLAGSTHLVADLAGVFATDEEQCRVDCVYAWGDNFSRKLGTSEAQFSRTVRWFVTGLSGALAVEGGGYRNGYALLKDGTVRSWGNNDFGQLGNGWTSNQTGGGSPVPVPVVGLTGVTAIAAGGNNAYALRDDGTVWAWGAGSGGQLGNGAVNDASTPVRVGNLTGVVSIAATGANGYAVRADGTVWAWGSNASGALGTGSSDVQSSVPVQVRSIAGAKEVAGGGNGAYVHSADGTVWAWGNNTEGQLGNGSTVAQSTTPVQVSGLTDAVAIAGGRYNGYAVRADGTVWAWGAGSDGALGGGQNCDTVAFPCASRTPVQVSGITDATEVASFQYGGYALHADGSVAAWGFNGYSSLGNPDAGWTSLVPVRVTGVSGATDIGAAEYTGFVVVPNP